MISWSYFLRCRGARIDGTLVEEPRRECGIMLICLKPPFAEISLLKKETIDPLRNGISLPLFLEGSLDP